MVGLVHRTPFSMSGLIDGDAMMIFRINSTRARRQAEATRSRRRY
jgi:hypothetical protein